MKKLKAQQITEFMLAAPLLILFFVILTEFAFAFNTQVVLSNALKSSVLAYTYKISEINREFTYQDEKKIIENIKEDLKSMNLDEKALTVNLITIGDNKVVVANYNYKPGFTFSLLPALKTINMSAISVFPYSERTFDGYNGGITPTIIDNKRNEEYQPPCKPCYVSKCNKEEERSDPIYDEDGNIVDYKHYTVCVSHCSESQGSWWCVESPDTKCKGSHTAEYDICS